MGKQVSTIKILGKVGDLVGYKDKKNGISARQRPVVVANPNTTDQRKARTAFLVATSMASLFRNAIVGLGPAAKAARITKRNMFVKKNYSLVTTSVSGNDVVARLTSFSGLQLSAGEYPGVAFSGARFDEALTIKANFTHATNSDDDVVVMVAYSPDVEEVAYANTTASTGTITLNCPSGWNGLTVHVYGYTLGFADAASRVAYLSWWSGGSVASEATAEMAEIESNLRASRTVYIGNGTIN